MTCHDSMLQANDCYVLCSIYVPARSSWNGFLAVDSELMLTRTSDCCTGTVCVYPSEPACAAVSLRTFEIRLS
jgi:hypothetical protein